MNLDVEPKGCASLLTKNKVPIRTSVLSPENSLRVRIENLFFMVKRLVQVYQVEVYHHQTHTQENPVL